MTIVPGNRAAREANRIMDTQRQQDTLDAILRKLNRVIELLEAPTQRLPEEESE